MINRLDGIGDSIVNRAATTMYKLQGQWPLSSRYLRRLDEALVRQHQKTGPTYVQVLCVYKRSYLRDQINALLRQTILPTTLFIYQNQRHVRLISPGSRAQLKSIRITQNVSWNSFYHGRFYVALLSQEPIVIVWDDDIVPGFRWNEYTINKSRQYEDCIVTANGRLLVMDPMGSSKCANELRCDDPLFAGYDVEDTFVDYGGHSWTFPRAALNAMASYHPPSLCNSEDFHISAASYLQYGIRTLMPAQSPLKKDTCAEDYLNGSKAWDRHASFLSKQEGGWKAERLNVINHWISDYLYKPLLLR